MFVVVPVVRGVPVPVVKVVQVIVVRDDAMAAAVAVDVVVLGRIVRPVPLGAWGHGHGSSRDVEREIPADHNAYSRVKCLLPRVQHGTERKTFP